jgi:hypothetical protein
LDPSEKPIVDTLLLEELQAMGNDEDDIDADETALDQGAIIRKDMVAGLLQMQSAFVQALHSFIDVSIVHFG